MLGDWLHRLRFSANRRVWRSLESAGVQWRKLDRWSLGGHDRFLDLAVGKLRGKNALNPFAFYANGWGDVTVPSTFFCWLEAYFREVDAARAQAKSNTAHTNLADGANHLPRDVAVRLGPVKQLEGVCMREITFPTPALEIMHLVPPESHLARALVVAPGDKAHPTEWGPTVVLLAGTGEHGYGRRAASTAIPLAQSAGITSIILESPFYGARKPIGQVGSRLKYVSDLPVLGRVTIEEACSLLKWLRRAQRQGRRHHHHLHRSHPHHHVVGAAATEQVPVQTVASGERCQNDARPRRRGR